MPFTPPPEPRYEYEVAKLVRYYKQAIQEILNELERLDVSDMSRATSKSVLSQISKILSELNGDAKTWVEENVPQAAREGVARAILSLGVVDTLQDAETLIKFNRANQNMVSAAVADTQTDLLAVTQNIDRKVRSAVRKVTADSIRSNMAKGINGRRTISRDILAGLRKTLGNSLNTGIVDAAGRRWKPEVYVGMVTRTKMMETYNEATRNEAVQRGALYAIISSHGATDACRFHEGRIMKLVSDAPGDYPTYEDLRVTNQIWHPNCRHTYSPIRRLDRLPDSVRDKAEKQAELGTKAIATGKRNPKDIN